MSKTKDEKLVVKEEKAAKKAEVIAKKKAKKEIQKIKQQESKQKVLEVLGDVKEFAGTKADDAVVVMKKAGVIAAQKAEDVSNDVQRMRLKPVFDDQLRNKALPMMIRICEPDKQHLESPVCQGSVGYLVSAQSMDVLNLYSEYADSYNIDFYPQMGEDIYFRHPFLTNRYIKLNDYFGFLKEEKIGELGKIAYDLGATFVKVSLRAQNKTFTNAGAKVQGNLPGQKQKGFKASGQIVAKYDLKNSKELEVCLEEEMKGGNPKMPQLHYFENEAHIQNLIEMRLDDGDNDVYSQKYCVNYNTSKSIDANMAAKMDAALKKMKLLNGNASISGEIEDESRLFFEYVVKF